MLRVVTAQGDELLADRTAGVDSLLAHLGMLHDALHLVTAHSATVCVSALAGMDQGLDAALKNSGFYRVSRCFLSYFKTRLTRQLWRIDRGTE